MQKNVLKAQRRILISAPPNHLAYLALCGQLSRLPCVYENLALKTKHSKQKTVSSNFTNNIPLHFGIQQTRRAQYHICEMYTQPQKGFYLCFSFLRKESCIEIHFKPQKKSTPGNYQTKSKHDVSGDEKLGQLRDGLGSIMVENVEGQTIFDNRYSIYKRLHVDAIGDIIAVFEQRQPVHENFALSGERRVGFRRTRAGCCKLYICGNQFRLPGCPKIEATFTFSKEDMVKLWKFFDSSLSKCLLRSNVNNQSLQFTK